MNKTDTAILESLIEVIRSSDDTWFFSENKVLPSELQTSAVNDLGMSRWSPMALPKASDALSVFYTAVPGPLPTLFEQMLLSYCWLSVKISEVRLFGNPPGPDLSGFQQEIMSDPSVYPILFSHGLVEFGKVPAWSYDPMCFDLKRAKAGDCPVVHVDHESVLIGSQARVIDEVAPSFRVLAEQLAKSG